MMEKRKYIVQIIGRSGSGKSFAFDMLRKDQKDVLQLLAPPGCMAHENFKISFMYPYTTRPPRPEEEGKPVEEAGYHFVTKEEFEKLKDNVVECREYDVINAEGKPDKWQYATIIEDPNAGCGTEQENDFEICFYVNSLDGYQKSIQPIELMTNYKTFGIYLNTPPEVLLYRSVERELKKPKDKQNMQEVLRRFYSEQYEDMNYREANTTQLDTNLPICSKGDITYINISQVPHRLNHIYPDDPKMYVSWICLAIWDRLSKDHPTFF